MKNILVDLSKTKNLYNGLGQFSYSLGKAFIELEKNQYIDDAFFTFLLPEDKKILFPQHHWFRYGVASQKSSVPRFLRKWLDQDKTRYDIWHVTAQDARFWPICLKKQTNGNNQEIRPKIVYTIHDLNYVHLYTGLKLKYKLALIQKRINQADVITTISHFVAGEIRAHLCLKDKPLKVIYNGVTDFSKIDLAPKKPLFPHKKPFFLSLGELTLKKNFKVILPLMTLMPEYDWVVAGKNETDDGNKMKREAQALGLADRVHFLGVVGEAERKWLYENCEAFLFPSLAEGFGLPVIEAMSFGKPVFLSNLTSLPEVAGSLGFYWADFSPEAMKSVLVAGLETYRSHGHFSALLRAHAAQFSWQKAALAYADIYRTLMSY